MGILDVPGIPLPATRVAFATLTSSNQSTAASPAAKDFTLRTMLKLPFASGRWRIGFLNHNLRSTTASTTPATVTGVYVGTPVYGISVANGGRWFGNCASALTQVSGALTVPVDGTRVWSAWIESADFDPGIEKVISWGMTTTASGNGLAHGNSLQHVRADGSSQVASATLTSPTTGSGLAYFDIVVEYEFAQPIQTGLFVGDSNTLSYVPSAPPLLPSAGAGSLPFESWPMVAGEMGGFAAINLGVGSTTQGEWASTLPILWDRLPLADAAPDFAVVSVGTNEMIETNVQAFLDAIRAINAKLRSLGIKRIFWTDITPRGDTTLFGRLAAGAIVGATTISSTYNAPNGTILVGSGTNAEQVTVSGTSGTGPYTLTVTALANAHSANEPVTSGREMARRLYNNLLRQMPDALTGVVSFEKALEAAPDDPSGDPRYVASDALHFQRSASIIKAQATLAAGVAPVLL